MGVQLSMFDRLPAVSEPLEQALRALPKIDLHAHLSGCLRVKTVQELIDQHGLEIREAARNDLPAAISFQGRARSYAASFTPWRRVLNRIMELPGVVPRLILELAEDFANDGVIYGELRVSPRIPLLNGELEQFLATVSAAVTEARARFLIDLRIIFGFERQRFYQLSTTEQDDAVARILRACERYCGSVVVGFDLWGIEDRHPPRAFERLFRAIRQAGYPLTIHAGEAHSSTFIREAIEVLQCNRLGHATAITRDPRLFELIRQRDILVEVCLTSNWITGIVEDLGSHPLRRMLTERIPVTLCTDNTLVYNTSLSRELAVALQLELISAAAVPRLFSSAAAHVFAPDVSPDALVTVLTRAYTLQATDHLASVASEARRLDD